MASLHIEITGTGSRTAQSLRSLVDQTRAVSNLATQVLAVSASYLGASPNLALDSTYADLAVALGLSDDTNGTAISKAHGVYNLLVAAQGRLTGTQISNFIDQLG